MENKTLDENLVREDMKALKKDIIFGTIGATLTGAHISTALDHFIQGEIGESISRLSQTTILMGLIMYPYLKDAYSRIKKYLE